MPESHAYLRLKLSQALFHKPPSNLDVAEQQRVEEVARRQERIEQRILSTPEAAQIHLPRASLEQTMAEIRGRYGSEAEFLADLDQVGLDPAGLVAAIERDLKFEAVLERIASRIEPVSDTDVEIYYLLHRERFRRPESRTLRHVLITVNDALPGSERLSALRKIEAIRERLLKSPDRFAEQALKHSECPTAMNGGLLGTVRRGQLFAELETAAFSLSAGELSAVIESPMGFHVLHCLSIEDASVMPLPTVREKIRDYLVGWRRQSAQKAWIACLFQQDRTALSATIQ